ncbi:MAG: hypothetical protein DME05_10470 [Candidatus Rokuibacteriota bacterium]|nr:MAG: hypothetical protein DME05_10470 [Candidatus Rokubacteria bacterium]
MPTHQSLAGSSDEELLRRMVDTHADRYGETFWAFFTTRVAPSLPTRPAIVDLGCGPGLFLRDLGMRYPSASLHGYDITPAMIAYGRQLAGVKLTLELHDVTAKPLPQAAGSVDLASRCLCSPRSGACWRRAGSSCSTTGSASRSRPTWRTDETRSRRPDPTRRGGPFASSPSTTSTRRMTGGGCSRRPAWPSAITRSYAPRIRSSCRGASKGPASTRD